MSSHRGEGTDAQIMRGDQQFLDLRGAFVDRRDFGIPKVAFDRVLVGVSIRPMHLDGIERTAHGSLRGKILGYGDFPRAPSSLIFQVAGTKDQQACGFGIDDHPSNQILDQLETPNRTTELFALLGIPY